MKITRVDTTPQDLVHFDDDELEARLKATDIEDVVEIFKTPLTGSYNWDYTEADNRIKKLYELGKRLNWDGTTDVDWSIDYAKDKSNPPGVADVSPMQGWEPYDALSEEKRLELAWHDQAWTLSQFLHGEQGALLVASQLVSCAPTYNAKLYAASQTFDEARHVEVFNRYLQQKVGFSYPINAQLKALLDKVLTDVRWDLKFIGMQIVIEGLALAAFNNMKMNTACPLLRQIVHYVIRDEARHVTFGVNYLEDFVATLTDEERDERGMFAFEACVVMRERILSTDVYSRFVDAPRDEIRKQLQGTESMQEFRNLLFSRIIPNLSRIGLLTDKVRPHFDSLGLLEYEEAPSDWEIDWSNMEKPYEEVEQIDAEAKQMRDFSRAVMESKGIHLHHFIEEGEEASKSAG